MPPNTTVFAPNTTLFTHRWWVSHNDDETSLDLSTTLTYCTFQLQVLAGGFYYKVIATFLRFMSSKKTRLFVIITYFSKRKILYVKP